MLVSVLCTSCMVSVLLSAMFVIYRFCMVRFAPKRKRSSTETVTSQTHIPPSRQHSLASVFNSGHINRRNDFPSLSIFEKRDSQCFGKAAWLDGTRTSLLLAEGGWGSEGWYQAAKSCRLSVFADGGPILSFSLSAGLQWIRPTHGLFHHMDAM